MSADGEYDNERDERICPECGEHFYGGSTATFWALHDHRVAEHGATA